MAHLRAHLTVIPTERFTYSQRTKTFTAEASELTGNFLDRLYDDALDVGFLLESARTGLRVPYVLSRTKMCPSGEDLQAWYFEPLVSSLAAGTSGALGTTVIIFND